MIQFSKVDHVVALDTVSGLIIQVNTVGTSFNEVFREEKFTMCLVSVVNVQNI